MRTIKAIYSELAIVRKAAPISWYFGRDLKTGEGVEQLYSGKKRRLQVCPD